MILLNVRDIVENIVKKSELLANVQIEAQKAGRRRLLDEEIDTEISAYRQAKKKTSIMLP